MIQYSEQQINVTYERRFRQPAFQISRSMVEILARFYEILSSEFVLQPSDLTSAGAQSMGEVAASVRLFGGNGLLELTVEKFAARFEGLRTQDDAELVKKALRLSEMTLSEVLPGVDFSGTVVRVSSWIRFDNEDCDATEFLAKFGSPKSKVRAQEFGAKEILFTINWQIKNEDAGWAMKVLMEPSELPSSHLFLFLNAAYVENPEFSSFENRSNHIEKFYNELMARFGLVSSSGSGENE